MTIIFRPDIKPARAAQLTLVTEMAVVLELGYITYGTCEFTAPEVFMVTDICNVKPKVDLDAYK